jgi:hypothetical protein
MDRILEKRPWVFYLLLPILVIAAFTTYIEGRVFERTCERESDSNSAR